MAMQQYRQVLYSAAALGGASGRTLALNNESWAQLDKVLAVYVATATVGNRVPTFRLLDAAGTTVFSRRLLPTSSAWTSARASSGKAACDLRRCLPASPFELADGLGCLCTVEKAHALRGLLRPRGLSHSYEVCLWHGPSDFRAAAIASVASMGGQLTVGGHPREDGP